MAILVNGGMWGGSEGLTAALYAIVAVGAVFSVFAFRRLLQRDEKKRQYLAKKLSQIDPTSQEFEPVFKEAFEAHDLYATELPAAPLPPPAPRMPAHACALAERRHTASR
jgi:hypothetical protein